MTADLSRLPTAPPATEFWRLFTGAGETWLAAPFDAFRDQYACAVVAGWLPASLCASGMLERSLDTLEKLVLGPLARSR